MRTVNRLIEKIRTSGSTSRKRGSGRPRTANTETNKDFVKEAIASQEDKPGTRKSQRKIARDLGIARSSVQNITKELELKPFKRIKVSRRDKTVKQKRKTRSKKLHSRYSKHDVKRRLYGRERLPV